MKERALHFYKNDNNCCQCIIKAFDDKYKTMISEDIFKMTQGVSSGFAIGGFCSALIGAVMILSYFFDQHEVKKYRLYLLNKIHFEYGSFDCSKLYKRADDFGYCVELISRICDLLDEIFEKYYFSDA